MKRLVENDLKSWKVMEQRKPLLLRGTRRVGKTYSILEFGKDNFEQTNVIYIDLSKAQKIQPLLKAGSNPIKVTSDIEAILEVRIISGKTLLIFDELKAFPKAIHTIRRIAEEFPRLHIAIIDSQLDLLLDQQSVPLHAFHIIDMQPMGFGEYLQAMGKDEAAKLVLGKPVIVSERMHELLLSELRSYFFVGGFPESVLSYTTTRELKPCFDLQRSLYEECLNELHVDQVDSHLVCLKSVLHSVARVVGEQIKYQELSDEFPMTDVKRCFDQLCGSRMVRKVQSAVPTIGPLVESASPRNFRALLADVGVLQHLAGIHLNLGNLKEDMMDLHHGMLAEQFVGQELMLAQKSEVYFWASRVKESTARISYLVSVNSESKPAIVVRERSEKQWQSIDLCLSIYQSCPGGLIFSREAYRALTDRKCSYFPIYYAYAATKKTGNP